VNIGATYLGNGKTEFTVWAPLKETMFLHIVYPFEKKIEMQKDEWGYFHLVENASPGCRYFFMPGGAKDLPDPASKYQPDGVHGSSEVIDHSLYKWNDANWKGIPFNELILYELHTGSFTEQGNFEAIISKLDHLKQTGVNAIELMPIAQFPGQRNWGYDGVCPYAVQNSYGGPGELKKLVDACHQKGIAVFLDVVYNHLGPEGNYLEEFAPYFTDRYKTPWGKAINFDGEWSDGVRDFFSDNSIYWFKYFHIDGLRYDAIHGVFDSGAVHIWELMHSKIAKLEQKLGRKLHTIAESDFNSPRVIRDPALGGFGFTAQWLDDFHHAMYVLLDEKGKKIYADFGDIQQLAKAFKDGYVHSGEYVSFRKRKHGASSAGIDGDKFVVFSDNHDQAGNRVTGARLSSLLNFEKMQVASACLLLSPYIPMIFMGEEYSEESPFFYFIDHSDKKLTKLVKDGRKKEFEHFGWDVEPPDPDSEDTFTRSKLRWESLKETKHQEMLSWYKQLLGLRKTHPALINFDKNDLQVNTSGDMLIIYRRSASHKDSLICLFNFSGKESASFLLPQSSSAWKRILYSGNEKEDESRQMPPVSLAAGQKILSPPLSVTVYEGS
jgi:maltooligosyltrehalose trehalohydrolase